MNRHSYAWICWLFATTVFAADPEADVIFRGGRIITVDPDRPQADAVVIRKNRIAAVLNQEEIAQWLGPKTRVIELTESQSLLPGLIESHAHLVQMGEALMTIDLSRKSSWEGIIEAVEAAVKTTPNGTWIVGSGWHQSKWNQLPDDAVDGYPTHERLSAISPNHPVVLSHASYHGSFANALAMKLAGIDASTADPPGGTILRNEKGEATGAMLETAAGLISRAKAKSDANIAAEIRRQRYALAVKLATEECLRHGVTTFSDAGLSVREINELISLSNTVGLRIRVHVMIRDDNDSLAGNLARLRRVDDANGFLTIRGIKKMIDGA
ncbi:MAG: amidohydrolase family protein, partial [Planctomycetota bacterium]